MCAEHLVLLTIQADSAASSAPQLYVSSTGTQCADGDTCSMGKNATEGGDDGNSSHIRTFLRIRPSKRPSGYIKVDEYDKTRLGFHVPVETRDGEVRSMDIEGGDP